MDRPNTVAGLIAKRKELAAIRTGLEAELRKVTCDLDHLDAAIRLFEPGATPAAVSRYTTQHRPRRATSSGSCWSGYGTPAVRSRRAS